MIGWYKWLLIVPVVLTLIAGTCCSLTAVAVAREIKVLKTYELSEKSASIEFVLQGYDGSFSSELKLPDGRVLKADKSTKLVGQGGPYWVNVYSIKDAPKGSYFFTIRAPKQTYYNLTVNVPLFADVHKHWAESAIHSFVERGIIAGYGNGDFGPNDLITGEAIVKMLVLALTEEMPNGKRQWSKGFRWKVKDGMLSKDMGFHEYIFTASQGEAWATHYIAAANSIGVLKDWKHAQLQRSFTRKDVALLLAHVVGMVDPAKPVKPHSFADIGKLDEKYQAAIAKVSNYSLFNGYPDRTFKPDEGVTRAEAVTVLAKLYDFIYS